MPTLDDHITGVAENASQTTPDLPINNDDEGNGGDSDRDEDSYAMESEHEEIPDDKVYHPDPMTPSVQSVYGLRPKRSHYYSHLHTNICTTP
jgi:hypothetical protein